MRVPVYEVEVGWELNVCLEVVNVRRGSGGGRTQERCRLGFHALLGPHAAPAISLRRHHAHVVMTVLLRSVT